MAWRRGCLHVAVLRGVSQIGDELFRNFRNFWNFRSFLYFRSFQNFRNREVRAAHLGVEGSWKQG